MCCRVVIEIEIDDEHLAPKKTPLFHTRGILRKTSHVRLGTGNSIVRGFRHMVLAFGCLLIILY
jgi:hypothetical protein